MSWVGECSLAAKVSLKYQPNDHHPHMHGHHDEVHYPLDEETMGLAGVSFMGRELRALALSV